jgi:SAM-dependent methyltransferase
MTAEREQRTVFGEVAETYHDVRPGYPEALLDDLVAFVGRRRPRSLEVGAGTGKATVALAARGASVVALEPSPTMAAIARRTCSQYPHVSIVGSGFEQWLMPPAARFDLVFSAQAWHWVDASIGYAKAHEVLRSRGVLALFWNRPTWEESELRGELDDIYSRHAPELHARAPGYPGLTTHDLDQEQEQQIRDSALFDDPDLRVYRWSLPYGSDAYVRLLTTQSDHRMLAAQVREPLLDAVRAAIDRQGGRLTVDYATTLFLTRKRD